MAFCAVAALLAPAQFATHDSRSVGRKAVDMLSRSALAQTAPAAPPATPSQPAPTARVGDGTVRGTRLKPYDNAWIVTQTSTDGRTIVQPGIWTDRLRLREVNGRKVFVRTQGMIYSGLRITGGTNVFDPETLAPISNVIRNLDVVEKWTFDGTHVESRITAMPGAKEEVQQFETPAPGYDFNCCMRSLIPAALPLRLGYHVILPAIPGTPPDDATVEYRVVKRERIQAGAKGMVDTWLVETLAPNGCDCTIRFWISDEPPFIIRMTLSPGKGHDYSQSFDMIK